MRDGLGEVQVLQFEPAGLTAVDANCAQRDLVLMQRHRHRAAHSQTAEETVVKTRLFCQVVGNYGAGRGQGKVGHRVVAVQLQFVDHRVRVPLVEMAGNGAQGEDEPIARQSAGTGELRVQNLGHQGDGVLGEHVEARPGIGATAKSQHGSLLPRADFGNLHCGNQPGLLVAQVVRRCHICHIGGGHSA